jgi:hypothetical protein
MFKIIAVCTPDQFVNDTQQPVLAIPVHHFLNRMDFKHNVLMACVNDASFREIPDLNQKLNEFVDELRTHPFDHLCTSTTRESKLSTYAYVTYYPL